eukprot:2693768-Rhodomonas_salina.1
MGADLLVEVEDPHLQVCLPRWHNPARCLGPVCAISVPDMSRRADGCPLLETDIADDIWDARALKLTFLMRETSLM